MFSPCPPFQGGGVPHLRSGGGYPIPGLDEEYQIPGLDRGVPHPADWGGTPSQVWTGGYPILLMGGTPSQVWMRGTPSQVRRGGTPIQDQDGGYPEVLPCARLDGVPPPLHRRLDATQRAVCLLRSRRRTYLFILLLLSFLKFYSFICSFACENYRMLMKYSLHLNG